MSQPMLTSVEPGWHVLVGLEEATSSEEVASHLARLRDRLGPTARLHVYAPAILPLRPAAGLAHLHRGSGAEALATVASRAAATGHLVVLLGPVLPDGAVVRGLLEAFDLDPLVGLTVPRFSQDSDDALWPLPGGSDTASPCPRSCLPLLPPHRLAPVPLGPCVAIRREVAGAISWPSDAGTGLATAVLAEALRARRRGFETLVVNRLVVSTALAWDRIYPAVQAADRAAVVARFPEAPALGGVRLEAAHRELERACAVSRRHGPEARLPVLLDVRGLRSLAAGPRAASLALLEGLVAEAAPWDVELLVGQPPGDPLPRGALLPARRLEALGARRYAAALCMGPPAGRAAVVELHGRALALAAFCPDAARTGGGTEDPSFQDGWALLASHADVLLFDSWYGRDRFGFRFPVDPGVEQALAPYPVARWAAGAVPPLPMGDHVLVLAGGGDGSEVQAALALLSRAFPFRPALEVLAAGGRACLEPPGAGGGAPPTGADADRMLRTAWAVVAPVVDEASVPAILGALAAGRTVVACASPRWGELAAQARGPGRLVEFATAAELVEAIGRAGDGTGQPAARPSAAPGPGRPATWREAARPLIDAVERALRRTDHHRWMRRELALRPTGPGPGISPPGGASP